MSIKTQAACEAWLTRADQRPARWLALFALVLALQISPLWYASPDGAGYVSIARSIAAGGPLARLGNPELAFPLGYPLLISPAFLSGPRPFLVLSIMHWILAVAFMLGVYRWMRRQLGAGALWLTGLVMANVSVWMLYRRTLSEAAFLTVMVWSVDLLDRILRADPRHARVQLVLAAALLILLSAIREAGVLFGVGFGVALLARMARGVTSRRAAATALAVTAAALLIALASIRPERIAAAAPAFAGNLAGYADARSADLGSLGHRLFLRMTEIGQLLVPGMFKAYGRTWLDINTIVYAPLLVAVAVGWWRLLRRRLDVFAVTAPLYIAVHVWWPYLGGTRYLLPLLPLLVACVWMHLEPQRGWRLSVVCAALLAHAAVAGAQWLVVDLPSARACNDAQPAVEGLAPRIGRDSGAVAAAHVPACVALMLALELERPVQLIDDLASVDATKHWILAPRRSAAVPGFQTDGASGDYVLLRRQG